MTKAELLKAGRGSQMRIKTQATDDGNKASVIDTTASNAAEPRDRRETFVSRRKTSKLLDNDFGNEDSDKKKRKGAPESRASHNIEIDNQFHQTGKIISMKQRNAERNGIEMAVKMTLKDNFAPESGVTLLEAQGEGAALTAEAKIRSLQDASAT